MERAQGFRADGTWLGCNGVVSLTLAFVAIAVVLLAARSLQHDAAEVASTAG